jgi:hypothetical protein
VSSVLCVTMQLNVKPLLDQTLSEMNVPWTSAGILGMGAGAIIALIDTGIDIFHELFRTATGQTQILELWDSSAFEGGSALPAGINQIGRVFNSSQINAGITAGPRFASLNSHGHGTHVAGIAAGNGNQDDCCSNPGRYAGVEPLADLVIVKIIALPPGARSYTRHAMRWCTQAGARDAGQPLVIYCSFGSDLGAQDGNDYADAPPVLLQPAESHVERQVEVIQMDIE